jgi:hypothetical protein
MLPQTVSKMLSPEEKTILANIESLVSQLRQMDAGAETVDVEQPDEVVAQKSAKKEKAMDVNSIKQKLLAGETLEDADRLYLIESLGAGASEVEMAMPDDEDPEEDEEVMMAKATASDSADDRIADNQENTTGDAVGEVGDNMKTIARSITDQVQKALASALAPVLEVQKSQGEAITGLLDGLGLMETIEKTVEPEDKPVQKSRPVVNMDISEVAELIQKASGNAPATESGNGMVESFDVRKSTAQSESRSAMASAMGAIFGQNGSQNGRY